MGGMCAVITCITCKRTFDFYLEKAGEMAAFAIMGLSRYKDELPSLAIPFCRFCHGTSPHLSPEEVQNAGVYYPVIGSAEFVALQVKTRKMIQELVPSWTGDWSSYDARPVDGDDSRRRST
jgi:hypothetical protein